MRLKLYIWERVLKMIVVCLFKLERKLIKHYGTQVHVNVYCLLKVTK